MKPNPITNLVTEKDNATFCPVRLAFIAFVIFYLYGSFHDIDGFISHVKDWASGVRDLLIGGIAVAAKAFTEKEPDHE